MSNIELLKKIPLILDVQEVFFTEEMEKDLSNFVREKMLENSNLNYVYKIIYKSNGHKVVGYIVEPKEGYNLPCIICNRGGSNEFGSIKESDLFSKQIARFAQNGYICLASQYSGNAGGEGKDEHGGNDIDDVLNLYKIIQRYKRINSKQIGMYGASRGGMMTYIALTKVKWIKAAVIQAGVTNLVNKKNFRPEMEVHYKKTFGGSLIEKKKRSALYWSEKFPKKIPILIMHGTADWRVDPLNSIQLAEKLYLEKVPYRLIIFEGGDHGLSEFRKEVSINAINWFDRFLKNCEKPPNLKPHGK